MLTELKRMCPDCFQMNYTKEGCPDCGYVDRAVRDSRRALPVGALLGSRYLVGRVLGIGGFGITYKAYDTLYQSICAIKEYAPSQIAYREDKSLAIRVDSSYYASWFAHGLKRFMEEAQMLISLESVPEVVRVTERFQENETAYYVMEFLDGTNLKKLVKSAETVLDSQDITDVVIGIGQAMDVIHRTTGILHRDITPENIFILKDGSAKLLDFGSARQSVMGLEQEFSVELKPGFAPLEQYSRNGRQGPYTDVYSLASTYYYALTRLMIPIAADRVGGAGYEPLHDLRPEISPSVSEAVDRALELDYKKRIQTMKEFVELLCEGRDYNRPKAPAKEKKASAYLEVLTGNTAGNRWRLPSDTEIRLGRSPVQSNIILTADPLISKIHCILVFHEASGSFLLKDVSRNGTFVENTRLEPEIFYEFEPEFTFFLVGRSCVVKAGVTYE